MITLSRSPHCENVELIDRIEQDFDMDDELGGH